MPAFSQVLEAVAEAYRDRRAEVDGSAVPADRGAGRRQPDGRRGRPARRGDADGSRRPACAACTTRSGAASARAPKFPPASAIEFLLRAHRRGIAGALEMATGTLDGMAAGGMYDVLAGGFARYSVDGQWLVPHFEKMLYDNALLASAYLHGHAVTGDAGLPVGRRGDARLPADRHAAARGRLRLGAGRGHPRRGGADVRVDAGGADARARAGGRRGGGRLLRRVRARHVRGRRQRAAAGRRAARRTSSRSAPACSRRGAHGPSPGATTRRSPHGTGWRWPRWPSPAGGWAAPTTWRRPSAARSSCSAR